MEIKQKLSLTKYIIVIPVVALLLLSTILLYVVIINQNEHLKEDESSIRTTYLQIKDNKTISINEMIAIKLAHTKEHYQEQNLFLILFTIFIASIVIIITIILSRKIASRIYRTSQELQEKVDAQTIELQMLIANKTIQNIEQTKSFEEQQLKNIKFTAIGQLAAGITHEINTPLTYIKGNFEMMKYDIEDLPDGDIKLRMSEDSEKIIDGINRLGNIVDSMREMSQKSKEAKENTNLYHTLITSLTLLFNRSKQISNIKINGEDFVVGFDKNKEIFISCIQKQRVEQVWVVIINNALDEIVKIKNFEDRLIDINISCNPDNCQTIVKIKDNAGGISQGIIDNVFEPFVSTKESNGMGVGLNVAKKIINDQDGEILAYNEDDGAVFEIRLECSSCTI